MSTSIASELTQASLDNQSARAIKRVADATRTDLAALRQVFPGALSGSTVYNAASLADGLGLTGTISVPGAVLGDFALVSFAVDLVDMTVTGYVSAADTVSFRIQNESTATVDLASTTVRALVWPLAQKTGTYNYSGTLDPSSLTTLTGETTAGLAVPGAALGDIVLCSFSLDLQGITVVGYVQAADLVELRFQNQTTGTINLASGTVYVRVIPSSYTKGMLCAQVTASDPGSVADGVGTTMVVACPGAVLGDFAMASFNLDNQDLILTAYVQAAGLVEVRVQNENAGAAVNLSADVMRVRVIQHATPLTGTLVP